MSNYITLSRLSISDDRVDYFLIRYKNILRMIDICFINTAILLKVFLKAS